jgi:hypothetical protein
MKELVGTIDASPGKRLFLSIIADYGLNKSVCELIDNALDNWFNNDKSHSLKVTLNVDLTQQTIEIIDNSGGIEKENLKNVISPGETGNNPESEVIGIFGVGTKRAVIALAQDVKIRSRYKNRETFMIEFDDSWLKENNDWNLPCYKVDEINESSTQIRLQSLRYGIDDDMLERLKNHLADIYGFLISKENFKIEINGEKLNPKLFEDWAYPTAYKPTKYSGKISTDGGEIKVNIIAGLSTESSPTGDYGIYFYCNKRLIKKALKSLEVGFGTGLAGKPHPSISILRVVVYLEGGAKLMPWNSSKSGVHYEHKVFIKLQEVLIKIVKQYAKISRALSGNWPENVFKFQTGSILRKTLDFDNISRLNLPPIPISKPQFKDTIKQKNKTILDNEPWTKGLIGGIIASDIIFKKDFDEKNRVVIILLDSTLEIGFKEFLVKNSGRHYSNGNLSNIFQNRHNVEREIKRDPKGATISDTDWRKIRHYYDLRCKLIHERASVGINDEDIINYQKVVEKVLKKLFGLKF